MIFDEVKEIIVNELSCDADDVTLETNLKEDLDADSLDVVELSLALEEHFEIEIAEESMENIATVKDIVDYIENVKNN